MRPGETASGQRWGNGYGVSTVVSGCNQTYTLFGLTYCTTLQHLRQIVSGRYRVSAAGKINDLNEISAVGQRQGQQIVGGTATPSARGLPGDRGTSPPSTPR